MKSWKEVLPLAWAYYNVEDGRNNCGGNLHIVLDDDNIDTEDIQFCLEQAKQEGDTMGVELARKLLGMSLTQRDKLTSHYELYCHGAKEPKA